MVNNIPDPSSFEEQPNNFTQKAKRGLSVGTVNLGKIFGYMTLGILCTGVFSVLFGWLFSYLINNIPDSLIFVYIGAFVASIGTLICSFLAGALSFSSRNKVKSRSVAIPFAIYSILIGYLFGLICFAIPFEVLAVTFGITVVVFGSLTLVGLLAKGNMNPLLYVSGALIFGCLMMGLTNWILWLFFPSLVNVFFWITSFVIFAALMLTTIWDVWQIKTISSQYENTPNLTLFCAFRLYCDFIAIFIRLLTFVLYIYGRNRN